MRRLTVLVVLVGVLAVVGSWWVSRHDTAEAREAVIPGDGTEHVTVEVLNGTRVNGLARRVTRQLRRAGIDVVFYGSRNATVVDSTTVVVRRSDSTAAVRVRDLLGVGTVVVDRDESLLLDVTVVLGRDAAGVVEREP